VARVSLDDTPATPLSKEAQAVLRALSWRDYESPSSDGPKHFYVSEVPLRACPRKPPQHRPGTKGIADLINNGIRGLAVEGDRLVVTKADE
jgi:hypothetical protein